MYMQQYRQKSRQHRYITGKIKHKKTRKTALVDYLRENKQPDINKVKELIEAGASVNARDFLDRTPLMYAARSGRAKIIKFLLEQGTDINCRNRWLKESALIIASSGKDARTARLLIENGANVNVRSFEGWTPLMIACQLGNVKMVKLFLEKGANVHLRAHNKKTALFYACMSESKDLEIIRLLIEHGAKANQHGADVEGTIKHTLLHYSHYIKNPVVKAKFEEIIELIESMVKAKEYERKMSWVDSDDSFSV